MATALAIPAAASACTVSTSGESQTFIGVGDASSYILAQGGDFSSGATNWTLNNATVQAGAVRVPGVALQGTGSLLIAAGGDAISPPVCLNFLEPTLRFLERSGTAGLAGMKISVLRSVLGQSLSVPVGLLAPSATWSASPSYPLVTSLPATWVGLTVPVQIEFSAIAGPVSIEGIYIDPYSRG